MPDHFICLLRNLVKVKKTEPDMEKQNNSKLKECMLIELGEELSQVDEFQRGKSTFISCGNIGLVKTQNCNHIAREISIISDKKH